MFALFTKSTKSCAFWRLDQINVVERKFLEKTIRIAVMKLNVILKYWKLIKERLLKDYFYFYIYF